MRIPFSSPIDSPLLALVNATAEWYAGLPAGCRARVRLLDRVHVTVHRGECVVVRHDDPASARVLLAALGGHPALRFGGRLTGERRSAPGVRVRRCSVSVETARIVRDAWRAADGDDLVASKTGPVVHLLRVSRHQSLTAPERSQWKVWARHARAAGGALVLVERPDLTTFGAMPGSRRPLGAAHVMPRSRTPGDALREGAAPAYAGTAPAERDTGGRDGATRELLLHHGRLMSLRQWE